MSPPLQQIDPWRAAEQGRHLKGNVPLSKLARLADLLADTAGNADFDLRFYRDERRRACIEGNVSAVLKLPCQRCLGVVEVMVDSNVSLAMVEGYSEAEALPDRYDPVLVADTGVDPLRLVEDELLLALPQVPRHAPGQPCAGGKWLEEQASVPPEGGTADVKTSNAFSVLAELKGRLH